MDMTQDTGPENLTLRYLRSIDERLTNFQVDTARALETITGHLIALTGRVAGLEIRMSAMESWSADATRRLERIERRLDLVETP